MPDQQAMVNATRLRRSTQARVPSKLKQLMIELSHNFRMLERVALVQVHLTQRNSQHYQRLACLGLHSI
jgi:hypothetical protein